MLLWTAGPEMTGALVTATRSDGTVMAMAPGAPDPTVPKVRATGPGAPENAYRRRSRRPVAR